LWDPFGGTTIAGFLSPELTKIMVKTSKEENDEKYKKKQNEM
jgi:hypothetical protein